MEQGQTAATESKGSARDGNSADALFELGLRYCLGRQVPKDLILAHKWFNLSAMRGNGAAKQYRLEIAREMSPCDVAEAQRQARAWLQTH
jgi:TPR repeat protein